LRRFSPLWLLCSGCFELDHVEAVRSAVRWDGGEQFVVDIELRNVDPEFFGCAESAEACVANVRDAMRVRTPAEASEEGDEPWFEPGLDLVKARAEGVVLELTQRGEALDLHAQYRTKPGSPAANVTGVVVERRDQWRGRGRTYLAVDLVPGRTLDQSPRTVRGRLGLQESGVEWSNVAELRPRHREVTVTTVLEDPVRPFFGVYPELDEALRREGLLSSSPAEADR
jgi:hypothetical protein